MPESDRTKGLSFSIMEDREQEIERFYFGRELNPLDLCLKSIRICLTIIYKLFIIVP